MTMIAKKGFTPLEKIARIVESRARAWNQPPQTSAQKRTSMYRSLTGFTLVEVLVVAVLFGLLGITLVVSFSTGMNLWKRAAALTYGHRQAIVGLERLSLDLRRALVYPPVGFFGTGDQCYFANVIGDSARNISYRYVETERRLLRSSRNLSTEKSEDGLEDPERVTIGRIENFTLAYFGLNQESGKFEFMAAWNSSLQGMPRAVRVSFDAEGGREFDKVILVPAGQ